LLNVLTINHVSIINLPTLSYYCSNKILSTHHFSWTDKISFTCTSAETETEFQHSATSYHVSWSQT